jgi:hypothetical protein
MVTIAGEVQQQVEAYLSKSRGRLHGFNDAEIREVVDELRSHITDKLAMSGQITPATVDAALAALGRKNWPASTSPKICSRGRKSASRRCRS